MFAHMSIDRDILPSSRGRLAALSSASRPPSGEPGPDCGVLVQPRLRPGAEPERMPQIKPPFQDCFWTEGCDRYRFVLQFQVQPCSVDCFLELFEDKPRLFCPLENKQKA